MYHQMHLVEIHGNNCAVDVTAEPFGDTVVTMYKTAQKLLRHSESL